MSKRIITVSREFGSGGRTIGKQIAERLGYAYYDKDLVKKIASESGLTESYILESGEHASSTNSFLFNLAIGAELESGNNSTINQLYTVQHNSYRPTAKYTAVHHLRVARYCRLDSSVFRL